MQQGIPGSSTNLASNPFPYGSLHHPFCFCHPCRAVWAGPSVVSTGLFPLLSWQYTSCFLYEKMLLPHLPWALRALHLPSHQYDLFEQGGCSWLVICVIKHMISSDPELWCWLLEHLSADPCDVSGFPVPNPSLLLNLPLWMWMFGRRFSLGVQFVFNHLPCSAALNTSLVALLLFSWYTL